MRSRSSAPLPSGAARRRSSPDAGGVPTEPAGSQAWASVILSGMDQLVASADAAQPAPPTRDELDAGVHHVRRAPAERGTVELIVRRPAPKQREVVEVAELDTTVGLVGDCWSTKVTSSTPDGRPHPDRQVTIVNARAMDLL